MFCNICSESSHSDFKSHGWPISVAHLFSCPIYLPLPLSALESFNRFYTVARIRTKSPFSPLIRFGGLVICYNHCLFSLLKDKKKLYKYTLTHIRTAYVHICIILFTVDVFKVNLYYLICTNKLIQFWGWMIDSLLQELNQALFA